MMAKFWYRSKGNENKYWLKKEEWLCRMCWEERKTLERLKKCKELEEIERELVDLINENEKRKNQIKKMLKKNNSREKKKIVKKKNTAKK